MRGVTPTDFQMSRGDCWLFATVGILEDSYRRYGVARGWLKPEEYLHISRQAFGAAVLDAWGAETLSQFVKVMPVDYKRVLEANAAAAGQFVA